MAKYSRYDSRNKKRNKHKNQYLGFRGEVSRKNCIKSEADNYDEMYEKYLLEKILEKY